MPQLVTVHKKKFDGSESSRFQAEVVESPQPGWIATFSDSSVHTSSKANRPPYRICFLSTTKMLTASFSFTREGAFQEAQCDVAMPATMDGDTITFVDLELDLVIRADGSHYLRDFPEFADHRERMGYTPEMVGGAHSALLKALRLYRKRAFPFDDSARAILQRELAIRAGS